MKRSAVKMASKRRIHQTLHAITLPEFREMETEAAGF
jgi:hypothetical protein